MPRTSDFPGVDEIFHALKAEHASMRRMHTKKELADGEGNFGIDVRLQVYDDGQWSIHTGSSDYDQDHRGFWGSGFLAWGDKDKQLKSLAKSLIDDAQENAATGGDLDDDEDEDESDEDDDEPSEPDEGDWVTNDADRENRGGREVFREVGTGKVMCEVEDGEDMWEKLNAAMERQQFFPNVWRLSDHGNYHHLTPEKKSLKGFSGSSGDIKTRYEDGETVPAINVKPPPLFHRMPKELQDAPEDVRNTTFEQIQQEWWEVVAPGLAEHILKKAFSRETPSVGSAGRSSGHLIVRGLGDPSEWTARQKTAWDRFEKAVKNSMKTAEKDWHQLIRDTLEG